MIRRFAICCAVLSALPVLASDAGGDFALPFGQAPLRERVSVLDSYDLPLGPYADGVVPAQRFEGRILRRSWRLKAGDQTTLQILDPLRKLARDTGFKIVFECAELQCGGFDFRFKSEVIPAPDMAVDIGDFRFVSATRGETEALSLLVSRSGQTGYVQVIQVRPSAPVTGPDEAGDTPEKPADRPVIGADTDPVQTGALDDVGEALEARGHVVLPDLDFATGSATLGPGPYGSLEQIAAFLTSNPGYRLALVGHTDSVGSLQDNIALSRQRAQAARQRLIDKYSVAAGRLEAEGVGYLAPLVSNMTPEGRETNRRVEAVLVGR